MEVGSGTTWERGFNPQTLGCVCVTRYGFMDACEGEGSIRGQAAGVLDLASFWSWWACET